MSSLISGINDIAAAWWPLWLSAQLQGSLFIALVVTLLFLLRPNLKSHRLAYRLMFIKLAIPPLILPFAFSSESPVSSALLFMEPILVGSESTTSASLSLSALMFSGWFLMVVALMFASLLPLLRFRRWLKNAVDISDRFPRSWRLGKGSVLLSTQVHNPCVSGFITPRIVLPANAENWDKQTLDCVVAHEVAHIENRDLHERFFQQLIMILFFPNPLVWFIHKGFNRLRESYCDSWAIDFLSLNNGTYAENIVRAAEEMQEGRAHFSPQMAFFASKSELYKRIHMLVKSKEGKMNISRQRISVTTVLAVVLLAFVFSCDYGTTKTEETAETKTVSSDETVYKFFEVTTKPQMQNKVVPKYPQEARDAGIEGKVIVVAVIGEDGSVTEARVMKSVHDLLDKAALEAAAQMTFTPAYIDGTPVKVQMAVPYQFTLSEEAETTKE